MLLRKKLVELLWKSAQLAAVMAGPSCQNAFASGQHGSSHSRLIQAIDYDFISELGERAHKQC
jgi:hypothetical protein